MTEQNDPLTPEEEANVIRDKQDVTAAYEMERILLDGPNRTTYRRTRHAFAGATARMGDMAQETHNFWSVVQSLIDVDLHAARLEALSFLSAIQQGGQLPPEMTTKQLWDLSLQMLAFAGQTVYSGFLTESVYDEEWLKTYEAAKGMSRATPDDTQAEEEIF